MGITVDVGYRSTLAWAPYAVERWLPAPVAAPQLVSLPTIAPPRAVAPARPDGQPSRMVAIARALATWRAAERVLAALPAADAGHVLAEAAVVAARSDYHRLFAQHRALQQIR